MKPMIKILVLFISWNFTTVQICLAKNPDPSTDQNNQTKSHYLSVNMSNGASECPGPNHGSGHDSGVSGAQVYNCESSFKDIADSIRRASDSFPHACWFKFKDKNSKTIAVLVKEVRSGCSDMDPVAGDLYAIENFQLDASGKKITSGDVKFQTRDLVYYYDLANKTQEFLSSNNYCD